jgi:rubrerythrin
MKLLSVKEIIEYAIKIEKESFAFYTRAAEIVKDDNVKKLVEMLALEEIDHQNRLRNLIDKETVSVEDLDKKHEINTTLMEQIVNTSEIKTDSSAMDVLETALDREESTEQTYAMLATLSNIDESIVKIFDELRLQERGHVNKIQYRIDHL